jgi:hypothetical protein
MLPATALAALGEAILSGQPRVTIADVDWDVYREQLPAGSSSGKFFATLLPEASKKSSLVTGNSIIDKVGSAPAKTDADGIASIGEAVRSERVPRMEAFVRAAARKVLGLSAGRPMPLETPMQEFGLDSLMALELRNVLAQAVGRPLSATLLFDYPSIRGLSQFLLSIVVPQEAEVAITTNIMNANGLAHAGAFPRDEELAAMSDDEAGELLLAELDRKGRA